MTNEQQLNMPTIETGDGDFKISQEDMLFPKQTSLVHAVGMRIGGYVIKWDSRSLDGKVFVRGTNFRTEYHDTYPILFSNGLNEGVGNDMIGKIDTIVSDDIGLRVEGVLDWNNKWWLPIMIKFRQNRLYWNASPITQLMRVEEDIVLEYPLAEFSLNIIEGDDGL